jgi:3-dehydroquinate dehydratase/shikimate dehydrogenase
MRAVRGLFTPKIATRSSTVKKLALGALHTRYHHAISFVFNDMPSQRSLHRSTGSPFPDRVCAVVAASTSQQALRQLREARRQTKTIELRLDWLRSDRERATFLAALRRYPRKSLTLLATCRRILGGGKLAGGAEAELYWLTQARDSGCQWCDLEIETFRELPGQSARPLPIPPKILLSYHDFERTPPLPRKFEHARTGEADVVKIAARARTIQDSLRLLGLARNSKQTVSVPMGEVGLAARLLALREGSALAYAPVAEATAPGQVSLREFKQLYRADRITHGTEIYGVIGNPIAHSLSPLMHNTGFISAKRDATYLPFLVEDLKEFVDAIPEFGLRGFSITLPHKETIMKYLAHCEPMAEKIGAVNTIVVGKNGKLAGSNTDYLGVLRALEKKIHLPGSRVLIFGAGGSARAAAFALTNAGAEVLICARRKPVGRELARACGGQTIARKHLRSASFEVIVNATPIGMYPHQRQSPLSPNELNCNFVMDLIYRPLRTQLLRMATKKRIKTVSGVEMFLAQGLAQWELWTGKPAPERAMRHAVLAKLRAEETSQRRK